MSVIVVPAPCENHDKFGIVQKMRAARNSPAVHKFTLATIRAYNSQCLIFVCEGVDDKKVYFHWLRYLNPLLGYEFQVCNGKEYLLEFRKMLHRDTSGLREKVYFFVDRDFDDLRGHPPGPDIYVSDSYSFENWIVTREVLNSILCVELHCHGEHLAREKVLATFDQIYASFLNITRPHNERIFLARQLGIKIRHLPTRLGKLAQITLTDVKPPQEGAITVINLEREPSQEENDLKRGEFDELDPQRRYRGKFALLFFLRWIELLGNDRNAKDSVLFGMAHKSTANANGQLSLDSVAAKSLPPPLFMRFMESITGIHEAGVLAKKSVPA